MNKLELKRIIEKVFDTYDPPGKKLLFHQWCITNKRYKRRTKLLLEDLCSSENCISCFSFRKAIEEELSKYKQD